MGGYPHSQLYNRVAWMRDWSVIVLSAFLLFYSLVVGYFWFVDGSEWLNPPAVHASSLIETDKQVYHPGDTVSVHLVFDKYRDIPGVVQWTLVDSRMYHYRPREVVNSVGHWDVWRPLENERLPFIIEPGEYYFECLVYYQVNSFRRNMYRLRTKNFFIVFPMGKGAH